MALLRDLFWHYGGYFGVILFQRVGMTLFPEIFCRLIHQAVKNLDVTHSNTV